MAQCNIPQHRVYQDTDPNACPVIHTLICAKGPIPCFHNPGKNHLPLSVGDTHFVDSVLPVHAINADISKKTPCLPIPHASPTWTKTTPQDALLCNCVRNPTKRKGVLLDRAKRIALPSGLWSRHARVPGSSHCDCSAQEPPPHASLRTLLRRALVLQLLVLLGRDLVGKRPCIVHNADLRHLGVHDDLDRRVV